MQAGKPAAAKPQADQHGGETIKAPMSGIFYRAPSPASPPYVREGDSIKEGQVICVIEAMKVFNEIKAEFNCVLEKVVHENGKPVEPNADLFLVKK
jgi:acetyl-CoA carboxylase biotin carboxyl carrier protein